MYLENIKSPEDLKKIPLKKMGDLAREIREKIIDTVSVNGGHMASNLGIVELTLALHRVFDSPKDAIIFDVSHQSYTHKLLTGRYGSFDTIRQKGGISGFTRLKESEHDYFDAGHASSSISSALGLLAAWDLEGRKDKVVAVIGDGALTGGMAFEALSHAGQLAKNLIVVLNDNKMSISRNTGAISRYLSTLTMNASYQRMVHKLNSMVDEIPSDRRGFGKLVYRFKRGLKGLLLTNNFFVDFGFEYVGPLDGHNISQLESTLRKVAKSPRPVVVHVVTKKGKGYAPAESKPDVFHGVAPLRDRGIPNTATKTFTQAFSSKIVEMAARDKRICAITAAMSKGTGLEEFSRLYKERFFDVGIAEEHAVTFAGGLSAGGMVPVCAIYSTFMQRSVDQIIEDLALQNRHAVLVLDRAGAVSDDGETHQGIFDIVLFKSIPGITFMSPVSQADLGLCMEYAVNQAKNTVLIRWPKAFCPQERKEFSVPVKMGRGILVKAKTPAASKTAKSDKILIVCTSSLYDMASRAQEILLGEGICGDIYALRFIKPFDREYFASIAKNYGAIAFVEDGLEKAGIGQEISLMLSTDSQCAGIRTMVRGFRDEFVANGSREEILASQGLDGEGIALMCRNLLGKASAGGTKGASKKATRTSKSSKTSGTSSRKVKS